MADFDLISLLARRLFRQPDTGHLRSAIRAGRDIPNIQRVHIVDAGDVLYTNHALMARPVSQPRRAHDVADGIDTWLPGAQPFVDNDMGAVDANTGVFETNIFDVAHDADSQND